MKLVKESLSPSEAIYGFASWLTVRDEKVVISARHDAAKVAELVDQYVKKQNLKEPRGRWEVDLVSMNERKSNQEMTDDIEGQIKRSKKIPKELKEKIIPLIIKNGIHGTSYNNGRVIRLKKT